MSEATERWFVPMSGREIAKGLFLIYLMLAGSAFAWQVLWEFSASAEIASLGALAVFMVAIFVLKDITKAN